MLDVGMLDVGKLGMLDFKCWVTDEEGWVLGVVC